MELAVVVIVSLALLVGVATRLISAKTRFPYTIAMLLLGIAAGLSLKSSGQHSEASEPALLFHLVGEASAISPDLIIFVFLPALIFESAYAIDVHVFKNNVGAVVLYAVPAMVLATGATALLMVVLLGETWGWGWPAALVFGALISATDPVAVVAILRELGVSKRLGVLIEGESLMNDGTAIVVFSVLVAMLTGEVPEVSLGAALLRFLWVVAGGIAVGLTLAFLVSFWIEKLFNDPLSEITLTLVLAYSAMIIAEAFLHVSGVMAVVTTGLWMGSVGRTKISPEVSLFLHRFWETLGYIANTLIFFLVGIVIAGEVGRTTAMDLVLVVVAYLGIMAIRFTLTYLFQPLANRASDGVSLKDSAVIAWGGLRGAVSLALALIVSRAEGVPEELGRQVLLVTAGVVLLTIVVNGTTISKLLSFLGYNQPKVSDRVQQLSAQLLVLEKVQAELSELAESPDLRTCQWTEVLERLAQRKAEAMSALALASQELARAPRGEQEAAAWMRVLGLEKQAYWEALQAGTLGGSALRTLEREISRQLDRIARGDCAPPQARMPRGALRGGLLSRLLGGQRGHFDRLSLLYDVSRAEAAAAGQVLNSLRSFDGVEPSVLREIEATYARYRTQAKERLEDLRTHLPEVASAIETRLAERIELNIEREMVEDLEHSGLVDEETIHQEMHQIDARMSMLGTGPTRVAIPETADLVARTPLFSQLDRSALAELADATEELVVPAGQDIFIEGGKGDALFVIARGAVQVIKNGADGEQMLDVLGGGDIVGEMALLTGQPRTATCRASTAVTLGRLSRSAFQGMMDHHPQMRELVWRQFCWRRFDNALSPLPQYQHLDHSLRRRWFDEARLAVESSGAEVSAPQDLVFLARGRVKLGGSERAAPSLLTLASGATLKCTEESHLLLLGAQPEPSGAPASTHAAVASLVQQPPHAQ